MGNIPKTSFSTDLVAKRDRYAMWCESISVIFDVKKEECGLEKAFEAHLDAFMIDQVMLARTQSDAAFYTRTAKQIRADSLDQIMVQLFIKGEVQFRCGQDVTIGKAGDLVIFDLSKEAYNFNTEFEHLTMLFPRSMVDEFFPDATLWHGKVLPSHLPMTQLLRNHMISLYELGDDLDIASAASVQTSLIELTKTAFATSGMEVGLNSGVVRMSLLQEIRKYIRGKIGDPGLSSDSIAMAFGLSRAQLYRLTEPMGGVMKYVKELRLERCMSCLKHPDYMRHSIAEIAYKWGFNDVGTFTRSFKKHYQILPSDVRALATQQGQMSSHGIPKTIEEHREYEVWVKSLV